MLLDKSYVCIYDVGVIMRDMTTFKKLNVLQDKEMVSYSRLICVPIFRYISCVCVFLTSGD